MKKIGTMNKIEYEKFKFDNILQTLANEKLFGQWLRKFFYLNNELNKEYDSIYQSSFYVVFYELTTVGIEYSKKVFEHLKLPQDMIIIPGVIDSTTNFVEHPEVVADRLIQFSTVINKEQLMAGTDCGFSTFAGFGKIDEEICYAKLNSLVEGASIASKMI